jgi:hypothetical protein
MQHPNQNGSPAPEAGRPAEMGFETTYNPLLGVEELEGWFPRIPRDQPGVALVLQRDNQRPEVVWPMASGSADPGPPFRGRVRRVHSVDVSDHHLRLTSDLPSMGDAHRYEATLHFTCVVRRPEEVVLHSIRDAGAALLPLLQETMRQVSRRYQIEDSAGAEQAVRAELQRREEDDGFHPAFALRRISVSLDLDSTARLHAEEIRRQRHEHRLADDTAGSQIRRAEQFRRLVEEGDWGMLRLALAQDPGRLPQVLQAMRNGADTRFQNGFQALKFLVENRVVGPEDIPQSLRELMGIDMTRMLPQPRKVGSTHPPEPDGDDD